LLFLYIIRFNKNCNAIISKRRSYQIPQCLK